MHANLILLDTDDFDVILGMDWLAGYHENVDFFNKTMTLKVDEGSACFEGNKKAITTYMISAM